MFHESYLWTSRPSLFFVICHVNPLVGSKPGCEISKPCFLTNFIYLDWKRINRSVRHLKEGRCLLSSSVNNSLFSIEVLNSQVFIPHKDVVIRCHNVRVQKSLGIPPSKQDLKLSSNMQQKFYYIHCNRTIFTIYSAFERSRELLFSTIQIHPILLFGHRNETEELWSSLKTVRNHIQSRMITKRRLIVYLKFWGWNGPFLLLYQCSPSAYNRQWRSQGNLVLYLSPENIYLIKYNKETTTNLIMLCKIKTHLMGITPQSV